MNLKNNLIAFMLFFMSSTMFADDVPTDPPTDNPELPISNWVNIALALAIISVFFYLKRKTLLSNNSR